ncbi:tyrosine-type recombinase/integrase [Paracoccus sp. (in: a-proteobacteria)]|uniref:tyrosine-type recombinase/integrase n=1 Tax=Paracoccus sp. TaxID=267 RepID=UPI003A520D58
MPKRRSVKRADDRPADAHVRARDYLGQPDVDRLLVASKKSRYGVRDHLLILMMFRHGLRVSETIALRRQDVDLAQSRVWIARLKNGLPKFDSKTAKRLISLRRISPLCDYGTALRQVLAGSGC